MENKKVLEKLRKHFQKCGFNLTFTVDPLEYDSSAGIKKDLNTLFHNVKSVILIGFGGNTFWSTFQDYLQANPEFKSNNIDLIDNYSILKFCEASKILDNNGISYKIVYPFGESSFDLNFMKLGELAGAGVNSLLGILLHPVYGPWISLRGAILADLSLDEYDKPLRNFAPCPSCDKPCISACPADTISESGWDWESCIKFRLSDNTCANSCASRRACPYGEPEQYSEEQLEYHHKFVLKSVREYLDT